MPTSSLEAVQLRLICEPDVAIAVKPVGILGGEMSPVSALKAAMCMTHCEPFWGAGGLFAPIVGAVLFSVRLPWAFSLEVKPVPAAVTLPLEEPAPKMRSPPLVVVPGPLSMG